LSLGIDTDEIRDDECSIIIEWARGKSGPGVNMNFKTKKWDNWNHEALTGPSQRQFQVDVTNERVDGGKLELIQFWWDKVSDIIRGLSKNTN
jgi:hypothetical protein